MTPLDIALALIGYAIKLVPELVDALSVNDESKHAPRLREVMKGGNSARNLLDERP